MNPTDNVRVRVFGSLRDLQRTRDLPEETEEPVPAEGMTARALAERMGLPVSDIEGIFCNHVICPLGRVVRPGDKVAFVPFGTPGPHRFFLGLYAAGKEDEEDIPR